MPFAIGLVARADLWSKCIAHVCGREGKRRVRQCCASLSCIGWRCWLRWRVWLTIMMMAMYLLISAIWLSSLTYVFIARNSPFSSFKSWYIGSFFVLGTLAVSLITLRQHWVHYTRPDLQRYIIRIAFFVHSYAFYSVSQCIDG